MEENSGSLWGEEPGLSAGLTLFPPPAVPCTPSTFKCSSKVCIGKANPECDGTVDCSNGWDETSCSAYLPPLLSPCPPFPQGQQLIQPDLRLR